MVVGIIITIVVVILLLALSIKIVPQYKRALVLRFGKYNRYFEPGFHLIIPIVEGLLRRDIREQTLNIEEQKVITKDNTEIGVDGIIWARVKPTKDNVYKSFFDIDDWIEAVMQLAQTNLRQEFGNLTLDNSLISREKIGNNLQRNLDKLSDEWGVNVTKVEIKEVSPPNDIKEAMHKQKTAEQSRRAARLEATGRKEAAEQDKEAKIQLAEGDKKSAILRAEGDKRSIELVAEGRAKAIKDVHTSAKKFFVGNAKHLKQLEVTEGSLKKNSKVILTEKGIAPTLVITEGGEKIFPIKKGKR